MHIPAILQRRRALRWLAPVGVVGVAGLAATGMFSARASSQSLPHTTPAALIAAVRSADAAQFSGTVVSQLSLGLPELPAIGGAGDGTSFTSMLSGSHTLQVWYGGTDKQRVALLGSTEETDVFRNGRDVWQWSSADQTALHTLLPDRNTGSGATPAPAAAPTPSGVGTSLTPSDLAAKALSALDPSTRVQVENDRTVADRSAYELILTPRTSRTKVASVHISVDGDTKVPLGVQVYARSSTTPAVDVAFTSIRFAHQPDRNFVFSPPSSAKVKDLATDRSVPSPAPTTSAAPAGKRAAPEAQSAPRSIGAGWTAVVALQPGKATLAKLTNTPLLKALTPVSGAWGHGRVLDSALLSVLITDDGRLFAGAVDPSDLYAAAGTK